MDTTTVLEHTPPSDGRPGDGIDCVTPVVPFASRAMFWRPTYLAPSAWVEHVPFAFWLVDEHRPRTLVELGSHWGVSYFAFCQAVARLDLDARCYAIDTWTGDDHAGFYGEEVYKQVLAHNEALYSGFSRLVRSRFDEALAHFSDGTIDLLHIDGLHTLDAVAHDFETWHPKLSPRAVVLFHDTNVRERGFGVYKLFERLRTEFPSFEFVHGHGLGVVGVGTEQCKQLVRLFRADAELLARQGLREVFGRLGRACADAQQRTLVEGQAADLRRELAAARKKLEDARAALDKARAELGGRTKDLEGERARSKAALDVAGAEVRRLQDRIGVVEIETARYLDEARAARSELATSQVSREAAARERDAARAATEAAEAARDLAVAERDAAQIERNAAFAERDAAKAAAHACEAARADACAERDAARAATEAAEAARDLAVAERDAAERARSTAESERGAAYAAEQMAAETKRQCDTLTFEKAALKANVAERFRELATLTRMLVAREDKLATYTRLLAERDDELDRVRAQAAGYRDSADEIAASLCWRLTAPVRVLADMLGAHRARARRMIKRSGLFDPDWYLDRYPDVKANGMPPLDHYLRYGGSEGRDPSASFSTQAYLRDNPDVAKNRMNALLHYAMYGRREGRRKVPAS